MTERKDCVFCGLLTGRLRSSVVFNDARLMGVMALRPTHVGHVLLFPAEHVEDFSVLDQATLGHLLHVAARLKTAICRAVQCDDFQLLINQGAFTGQKEDCRHLHVHLIPLSGPVDQGVRRAEASRAELDAAARDIVRAANAQADEP